MTARPATHPDRDSTMLSRCDPDAELESASGPRSALEHGAKDFAIRDATSADNQQLIALAAACSMIGDISMRIDRGPDFFALNRLEGQRWRVGVAERGGMIVGCVAISERLAFVNGRERRTGYVGDLKVHPAHRDTRIADELSHYAERVCEQLPPTAPVMITVLAGNRAMERRLPGPRGVPVLRRIATIRTHSIPILWWRRVNNPGSIHVATARWTDLDEMAVLWSRVAPLRQLAPVLSASALADWILAAPGLGISSYRLARSSGGELLGFLAVWDQRMFKQLNVVAYSPRMNAARGVFNLFAPLVGGERMPQAGSPLNCVSIAHICVPGYKPQVLRALVISAYNELRHSGCSFMNLGLDRRDPLSAAMAGLLAQPTDVNAYIVTTRRGVIPEYLDERPLHNEIALV
ncbi:MAG TPA: GNAT family N-acetyltransferase [Gemmatimonadaceae bacterium]|nr:GNAT family N-acetyltransferase [Gemmatimonadaceae bacterium]